MNLDNINLLDFQTADKTENSQNESDESTDQVFAGVFFVFFLNIFCLNLKCI